MNLCFLITTLIAILLGNFIKLRATITGPAPADGDGPGSQVCPMCCQGPAGTPGIPGLPGNQGQLGPAGVKGDAGVKGQKGGIGQIGAVGGPGPKGDNGMGLPGKVGPRGPPGSVGRTGEAGVKGQKGEIGPIGPVGNPGPKGDGRSGLPGKVGLRGPPGLVGAIGESGVKGEKGDPGETSYNSAHRVAFTVRRIFDSDKSTTHNTRLPFEEVETLLPGTSFNLATGTFTCGVPGTYVFTFSVNKEPSSHLWVHLRKNNDPVISGGSSDSNRYEQVSGSAVMVLQRGDSVYLTMEGRTNSGSHYHYTSFSGFLLYPE